jgi:hypothetical protein
MWKASKAADSLKRVRTYRDFVNFVPAWSGFNNPQYDATAWQSALTLGAAGNMGFDTVRTLSRLYTLQAKIDAYASDIGSFEFADATMPVTVRRMWVYFATVTTEEDTILNRYEKALTLLGPTKKP